MAVRHAIGQPENDSERKAITCLVKHLPDDYHVFHNLELPDPSGLPYEYDVIVVGEYAVYVVEVKGYRKHIRGNAQEWELESGAIYRSPIPLANKKARVLATRLRRYNRSLGGVWVQPIIVLTDDHVRVHLNDEQSNRVVHLKQAVNCILDPGFPARSSRLQRLTHAICEAISHQFGPLHRRHQVGDYQVLETIGKNDLYTLLLAEHPWMPGSRFNLKIYSLNINASSRARRRQRNRLLRAANALHRLAGSHPNIVRAHPPFPWEDNKIVLPLDWVAGYSLRGLLDEGTEMSFARKVDIVCQVAEGLCYAHDRGVIHRDVRSENIIVSAQGLVKLVNFDCARLEGAAFGTITPMIGRRLDKRYAAPEIWDDPGAVSRASDQYALGTVLYELLTGQPPCQDKNEIIDADGLPCRPTELDCTLDRAIDDVITRMCAYEAKDRYDSMTEVIEDLRIIG